MADPIVYAGPLFAKSGQLGPYTINYDQTPDDGDTLVLLLQAYDGGTSWSVSAGWMQVAYSQATAIQANKMTMGVWVRAATGGDPSPVLTVTGNPSRVTAVVLRIPGTTYKAATAVTNTPYVDGQASGSTNPPPVTTGDADQWILTLFGGQAGANAATVTFGGGAAQAISPLKTSTTFAQLAAGAQTVPTASTVSPTVAWAGAAIASQSCALAFGKGIPVPAITGDVAWSFPVTGGFVAVPDPPPVPPAPNVRPVQARLTRGVLTVFTAAVDGTDRRPLDQFGDLSGPTFANNTTGGDTDCQFSIDLPVDASPSALTPGRLLIVHDGPLPVWRGLLADPTRGTPWRITGQSLASLAADYLALAADGTPTINPNTAIDQAVARGLPWQRTQTFPTPAVTPSGDDLGALLDAVALVGGQQWQVDQWGYATITAIETAPSLLLTAVDLPGGRTLDDFYTAVWVKHVTGYVSGVPTIAFTPAPTNPTGPGPWGRRELRIDKTADGTMTVSAAQALGNAVLAGMRPSPQFTGAVTCHPGDLTTIGGQPVALSTVRAGQRVAVIGAQPDPAYGELLPTTRVEFVIGEARYDADQDALQLTPLGAPKRDLQTLLTAAASARGGSR